MLLVALSCGGVGLYLFVWGVGDVAVGRVGSYQLGGPEIQGMRFASPAEFEESIEAAAVVQPTLRRLALRCPDGRVLRTIYRLPWGTYGVPARDLVCADGFQLVTYAE